MKLKKDGDKVMKVKISIEIKGKNRIWLSNQQYFKIKRCHSCWTLMIGELMKLAVTYKVENKDGKARAGIITTPHGEIETPVFYASWYSSNCKNYVKRKNWLI